MQHQCACQIHLHLLNSISQHTYIVSCLRTLAHSGVLLLSLSLSLSPIRVAGGRVRGSGKGVGSLCGLLALHHNTTPLLNLPVRRLYNLRLVPAHADCRVMRTLNVMVFLRSCELVGVTGNLSLDPVLIVSIITTQTYHSWRTHVCLVCDRFCYVAAYVVCLSLDLSLTHYLSLLLC